MHIGSYVYNRANFSKKGYVYSRGMYVNSRLFRSFQDQIGPPKFSSPVLKKDSDLKICPGPKKVLRGPLSNFEVLNGPVL